MLLNTHNDHAGGRGMLRQLWFDALIVVTLLLVSCAALD
jgi:hypothetical protein